MTHMKILEKGFLRKMISDLQLYKKPQRKQVEIQAWEKQDFLGLIKLERRYMHLFYA